MLRRLVSASIVLGSLLGGKPGARAETMVEALSSAYRGNPDLNQRRAATRASDEGVSRAVAGYRPQIAATASLGYNDIDEVTQAVRTKGSSFPTQAGVTVTQTVFNGNRTSNGVRQAESQVFQAREQTRTTEQTTLLNGATAYMNVLRDTAILGLDKNNIIVLEEQLRQVRDRFHYGELTRTDVAQSASSLATARSGYFTAAANLQTSIANFRQVIGIEPRRLEPARPIDALLPVSLQNALDVALTEHPAIQAALHNADAASIQVQLTEAPLYPTFNVVGSLQQSNQYQGIPADRMFNASVLGQLSIPLYSGGETYASVRQAKELVTQARLQADLARDQVRADLVTAWGQREAARATMLSTQAAVRAAEIALDGVREEAQVGQRTTLDVLMAQQTLLNARVSLVTAQRDRVVTSYAILAATGRLSAIGLNLPVTIEDPTIHFDQVKDKWAGLRTPGGS